MENKYKSSITDLALQKQDTFYAENPIVEQEVVEEADFGDKFVNAATDSFIVGGIRTAFVDGLTDPTWKLTQEDVDKVQKELGGDYETALWVCQNASSAEGLERLTEMKKADLERLKRIDVSDVGFSTLGTVIGSLTDPMAYVPLLGVSGKAGTLMRYAKLAAANAGQNVVERMGAQAASGYEQDYVSAALLGGVLGAGLPAIADYNGYKFKKTKDFTDKVQAEYAHTSAQSEAFANGTKPKDMVNDIPPKKRTDADTDLFKKTILEKTDDTFITDEVLSKKLKDGNTFVLSLEDAKALGKLIGEAVPDDAKAFFDSPTGFSALIKDNLLTADGLPDLDNIKKTFLHERGSHGLRHLLSEEALQEIFDDVKYRMTHNPSGAMKRAMKRAYNQEDIEEVLGYLAEELKPSNPLMKSIRKKVNKTLNAMGAKGRLSDQDFLDIMQRSAETKADEARGYRKLDDGTTAFGNFKYSRTNILSPENIDETAKYNKPLKKIGDTISGRFIPFLNSPWLVGQKTVSPMLKKVMRRFVHDPTMTTKTTEMSVEKQKQFIMGQFIRPYNEFMRIRNEACLKQLPIFGRFSNSIKDEFNKKVWQCYNATYAGNTANHLGEVFDTDVVRAAAELKKLRELMIDMGKNSAKLFGTGKNYLPEDWKALDDEMWRIVDRDAWASFMSGFPANEDAIDFLTKYAKQAAKRDIIRQRLEDKALKAWQKEVEVAKKTLAELPSKPAPLTDEMLEAEVEKQAKAWATGLVDKNLSRYHLTDQNITTPNVGSIDYLQHRFPMDTSVTINDPWGGVFSYDETLRSYDFDNTVGFILNRFAGEYALNNVFSRKQIKHQNAYGAFESCADNISHLREVIRKELQEKVDAKEIAQSTLNDDLAAFDYVMDKIAGVATSANPKTKGQLFANVMCDVAYAQNSTNMMFAQLGEISGTMAYAGFDAMFDLVPAFGKLVSNRKYGKDAVELIDNAILDTWGDDANRYIWHHTTTSKKWQNAGAASPFNRTMDAISTAVNYGKNFASTINFMPKLTHNMIYSARKQTLIDTIQWVNGKSFPKYRNPFSNGKLKAAGISDPTAFKEALRPYAVMKDGKIVGFDVKQFHNDKPMEFARFLTLVDNQAMRCITQPTIGNTNLLKETSPYWRIFFQFKDFVLRANQSQSMRAFYNQEVDDGIATAFGMITNATAVVGLAWAKSYATYGDNEIKRKEYLDKYINPYALLWAGVSRSPILGSPVSIANDVAEVIGESPAPTMRTTVNRYQKADIINNPGGAVGETISQLPAVKSFFNILEAGNTAKNNIVNENDYLSKAEVRQMLQVLPGTNNLLFVKLREEWLSSSSLPHK